MANNCGYWRIGVSIPIGFSSSLQHVPYDGSIAYTTQFQSLSGFQVRCNFKWRRLALARRYGFNPYRVFKFVATERLGIVQLQVYRFQSLSGFQVRCNFRIVSALFGPMPGFNPYRVFKFVATAPFEWLFLAIILSKSQKLRPPGMNLFHTRPL